MANSFRAQFLEQLRDQNSVAPSPLIMMSRDSICSALDFAEGNPECAASLKKIKRVFGGSNWLLDENCFEQFCQTIGEIQFWQVAQLKGVELVSIPEEDLKTPDFALKDGTMRFEAKTLSVPGGQTSLRQLNEASFEAQRDLGRQIQEGRSIAISELEVAPHGPVPREVTNTTMCRNLIDKIRGNIKQGQFEGVPTCLVVNMMLIDSYFSDLADLRPVVAGYPEMTSFVTGTLWTVAFGTVSQLIHCSPEFEGKPGIEGILDREGVLRDRDYGAICALLLLAHRGGEVPELYGLRRHTDPLWEDASSMAGEVFHSLVGEAWNDDRDSNGYAIPARG